MDQKGFSQIILLGIISVLVLVGAIGFFVYPEKKKSSFEKTIQEEISFKDKDMTSMTEPTPFQTQPLQSSKASKITYPNNKEQVLAYFCKPNQGSLPYPAVIYNHGGKGNKIGGAPEETCLALAQAGFIGFSPIYRPNISFDGYVGDIFAAIKYLQKLPEVNASRLGIMGFSRGGLATLVASIYRPNDFKAIVLMAPAPGENNLLNSYLPYVNKIGAPVLVQVAKNDIDSPANHLAIAQSIHNELQIAKKTANLIVYPPYKTDGHRMFFEIGAYWKDTIAFLQDNLAPAPVKKIITDSDLVHNKLKELKQEAGAFNKNKMPTKEHYQRIEKDLVWLEQQNAPVEELSVIRKLLEPWNPLTIEKQDRQAAESSSMKKEIVSDNQIQPQKSCVSNYNPVFTTDITDLSKISQINAPVMIQNSGVVKSHSYLWINGGGEVPVYAPVDSQLTAGSHFEVDYGLIFTVSCEVTFRLGHITRPIDAILSLLPNEPQPDSRDIYITTPINFKAGDLIGYTSGTSQAHNWDFGVYNNARLNSLSLSQSGVLQKDITANCPFDYYQSEKRSNYYGRIQSPPNASILLKLCNS